MELWNCEIVSFSSFLMFGSIWPCVGLRDVTFNEPPNEILHYFICVIAMSSHCQTLGFDNKTYFEYLQTNKTQNNDKLKLQ